MSTDTKEIENLALEYYDAMVSGDTERLKRIFAPDACLQGVREGEQIRRDLQGFLAVVETPAPPSPREVRVALIDRAGPVAIVRVDDVFRGQLYSDYLTLVENGHRWQIVNKAFWVHPAGAQINH